MIDIEYFLRLIVATLMGLAYAWPITILLLLVLTLISIYDSPFTHKDYNRAYLAVFLPSSLTFLILLCHISGLSVVAIYLLICHVPMIALLAKRLWQYQWFVIAAGLFQMWVSLVATFIGTGAIIIWRILGSGLD
jgi:hypothetical protein